jgi:hypothetical protein
MADTSTEILKAICEMRDLIRLMAEPQIAARDQKLRDKLIQIVGNGKSKQKAVFEMDGNHTQMEIHKQTGMNLGNLSTLVKKLSEGQLLSGDLKKPKLTIPIPSNLFDQTGGLHE